MFATGVVAINVKFTDSEKPCGASGDLNDLAEAVSYMNTCNGPLSVGLGISEERGLKEDAKLETLD